MDWNASQRGNKMDYLSQAKGIIQQIKKINKKNMLWILNDGALTFAKVSQSVYFSRLLFYALFFHLKDSFRKQNLHVSCNK